MLRDHLKENGISVYALSRDSGISYSTLNDLVNGKVEIDNCRVSLLRRLGTALGMPLEDIYRLCVNSDDRRLIANAYNVDARLSVRKKSYFCDFCYKGERVELRLCRVSSDTSFYIDDIARWRVEAYIRRRRMEDFR